MNIKNLLDIRKRAKEKKPKFIRQDFHKKTRLKEKWRRPKGLHSKIRLKIKGKAKPVSSGYRSPKKVRGMHKTGLEEKMITSIKDLETLDFKKHGLIISSSLGNKKKIIILKKAKELGLNVMNIKNPGDFIKKVEDMISAKNKSKKEEKKIAKDKTKKTGEKLSDKLIEEDKEDIGKKEKDKILTKRER